MVLQDISGGQPVQLEGTDLPVWGMEIDPDKAKQQFRSYSASDKGSKVRMLSCHYQTNPKLNKTDPKCWVACTLL